MREFLIAVAAMTLAFTPLAYAQTDPDVLKAYKEYSGLLKGEDKAATAKAALKAWELAEEKMGDSKTTGNLAINYGDAASLLRKGHKKAGQAYERAIELSHLQPDDEQAIHVVELYYKLANFQIRRGDRTKARKTAKIGAEYALENGLETSTFLGELYTIIASTYVSGAKNREIAEFSEKALDVFENSDDGIVSAQPLLARLYSGYAKEGEKEILGAALEYQDVMENVEGILPRDHPFMMKALGRWSSMRERLSRDGRLDEAEEKGLCQCWPYDKPRNEAIKPVKRVPPIMPARAFQSGFSIVEFDLKDDGSTDNIRVLESWPPDIFEKSSEKSIKKWQYTARQEGETDEDRKDIITTVRYVLTDRNGDIIE